ncbi:vWA domain-containing protein [Lactiplantibacillus plajomi]|uniref:VWA-like domain-containing protein n=1 Tax=Lactiplantibacillus plajomi TaxID=1457217 RepID=A0ABV6K5W5_9LACO|nr:VWA-like domain-containing protein [Lactiplantibacillus plajomi]
MINHAAEYAQWRQATLTTRSGDVTAGLTMVTRAVIDLLARDQFYGELLTRLPRELAVNQTAPFALAWRDNRLVLKLAPNAIAAAFPRFDSLQAGLKHVALHVVWQHPLRYRQRVLRQPELVRLATDLAVNQYVTGLPAGMTGLATVQPLVATRLPLKADSGTYLKLLQRQQTSPQPSQAGKAPQPSDKQQSQVSTGHQPLSVIDDPQPWAEQAGGLTNPNLAASRTTQLTHDAWAATNEAGRGLVAGKVVATLKRQSTPAQIDWRQWLVRGLGRQPAGKRPSRARFNRRQPARMELPGQVSDQRLDLQVYVDNSGSISDQTLRALLAQVAALTRLVASTITVKPFDAIVQPGQRYQAQLPQQVRFNRRGGGGTVYQSIFDDLAAEHRTNATTLALILTDGRGERTVACHHFTNVIWLLAKPSDQLSVQPVVGRVVHLNGGDADG